MMKANSIAVLADSCNDIPQELLDRYGLIQRVCPENTRKYKDVLVHRKDYELTELDNTFIEQLVKAKRKTFG